jgi:ABC-type amino acid transport substrate-binding protein
MAVLNVLNDMRKDGSYDKLMDKWGAAKMPADKPLELKGPDMP